MSLPFPLPTSCHMVAVTPTVDGERLVTLQMTIPYDVAKQLSVTLELAARLTGSERMGALLAAINAECQSTWIPQMDDPTHPLEGLDPCLGERLSRSRS